MGRRKDAFILGILASAAACFLTSKLIKNKKQTSALAAQGFASFKEQKFEEALTLLLQVENPDFETNIRIFECYERLGSLTNALIYLNRCIKLKRLDSLILKRFSLHSSLEMNREAFKDLFLVNLLNKGGEHKENASEFLKKMCGSLAKAHKIEGFASPVNYSDFFETLFFLKDKQDPAIVFLNSAEYEKCFEFVKGGESELHRFILGCFYLVNGDFAASLRIFESLENQQTSSDFARCAKILMSFIKSKKLTKKEISSIKENLVAETDPTILYYISKIFESIDNRSLQFEALQKCVAVLPNSCALCSLIVWHIRQKNHTEAYKLIKSSLKDYSNSMNLVCIALEYFLMERKVEEAVNLMEKAEKVFANDPRIFLFKHMINEALGRGDAGYLQQGIDVDPKYFKLYVYLGNSCQSGEESAAAYKKALECARSYDEIFTAYQLLVVVETQNELFREFPDLFTQETVR